VALEADTGSISAGKKPRCLLVSLRPRWRQGTSSRGPNYGTSRRVVCVLDPGEGVCADPVNGDAILGKGELDPQGGNKERQLSPDKERDKT
jgi:hypothetical protein